ncbi:uncharacterized protein YggE [Lachnospiraceae bacterium PFB1-21]
MTRIITVKGVGNVSTKPDYVVVSMNLEVKDKEYDAAMDLAAEQLEQLNDSLMSIGFEKKDLKTTNFSVDTDYKSIQDKQGNYQRVFNGFVCRHQLKLSFDFDMKRLSQVLSTVAECLAHPEMGISFTVKDATAINEALLREATANAKRKAELLCEASEVKLGKLITIDYNWGELNIYSDTRYDIVEDSKIGAVPMMARTIDIEPDDIEVRDTATFVWEIE